MYHTAIDRARARKPPIYARWPWAHTWRYHKRHRTVGHVWQGRFKSPVVQDDAHLLIVLRYIEANPLRAGMVSDPNDYPWSSYPAHGLGDPNPLLSSFPEWDALGRTPRERQARWRRKLMAAQDPNQIRAVRETLRTGRPFGDGSWAETTARVLGIAVNPRPRGRPRKVYAERERPEK
jgi:putative transposase